MIEVLSLGAGVQSTTALLMSIRGELPKLDHAIFADTGWEPQPVYQHVEWCREQCEAAGIQFHKVSAGNIRDDAIISRVRGSKTTVEELAAAIASNSNQSTIEAIKRCIDRGGVRCASLPFYTKEANATGDQREGQVRRQCTAEYKIVPIERRCRELLGLKKGQRWNNPPAIRQWFGISFDERRRMRIPELKWKRHFYPFIDWDSNSDRDHGVDYGKSMTRAGCLEWCERNGYPEPPRSACVGCPYHSDAEWRAMKLERPEEFEDACQFDDAIRYSGGMRGLTYLHRSCVPLRDVDFSNDIDRGQLVLFGEECSGMCGV